MLPRAPLLLLAAPVYANPVMATGVTMYPLFLIALIPVI
jgi:hypothetical protein